jgi:hypothetical protein
MADAISHDQNFKNLILDYPREALAFFAADEAPSPEDDVRIVPVRQEQLKATLSERFRELDAPLLVEWADGRRDAVLFALEEETQVRRFSSHRFAHYCLDLAELFGTDRVVPVAIFLRGGGAAREPLALGTERRPYLTFDCVACRLGEMSAERWRDSGNVVARVNLPNMRSPESDRVDVCAAAVGGLLELEPDKGRRRKYLEFIDMYAALTDNEYRQYRRQYPEESNAMAGVVQRARDEGMQQGRIEGMERGRVEGRADGMEQGRVEGERAVLERLLRRRFGPLPAAAAERLGRASAGDLETWAENVLDAERLGDVFD